MLSPGPFSPFEGMCHDRAFAVALSTDPEIVNLSCYRADCDTGVEEHIAGKLNTDDLLTRREVLSEQEEEIANLAEFIGFNVAEPSEAIEKLFEQLNGNGEHERMP